MVFGPPGYIYCIYIYIGFVVVWGAMDSKPSRMEFVGSMKIHKVKDPIPKKKHP